MLLTPATAWAGAQREETLADDVASVMRSSINSASLRGWCLPIRGKGNVGWRRCLPDWHALFPMKASRRLLININTKAAAPDSILK